MASSPSPRIWLAYRALASRMGNSGEPGRCLRVAMVTVGARGAARQEVLVYCICRDEGTGGVRRSWMNAGLLFQERQ